MCCFLRSYYVDPCCCRIKDAPCGSLRSPRAYALGGSFPEIGKLWPEQCELIVCRVGLNLKPVLITLASDKADRNPGAGSLVVDSSRIFCTLQSSCVSADGELLPKPCGGRYFLEKAASFSCTVHGPHRS